MGGVGRLACALLALLVPGCAGPSVPPTQFVVPSDQVLEGYGRIHGMVLDADGSPLALVEVRIEYLDRVTVTSDRGTFVYLNLQPFNYTLLINHTGFKPHEERVAVSANEITQPVIRLERGGPRVKDLRVSGTLVHHVRSGCVVVQPMSLFGTSSSQYFMATSAASAGPVMTTLVTVSWDRAGGFGAERLQLGVGYRRFDANSTWGPSPLNLRIENAPAGETVNGVVALACPNPLDPFPEIVVEQPFVAHVQFWYGEPAPPGAVAHRPE